MPPRVLTEQSATLKHKLNAGQQYTKRLESKVLELQSQLLRQGRAGATGGSQTAASGAPPAPKPALGGPTRPLVHHHDPSAPADPPNPFAGVSTSHLSYSISPAHHDKTSKSSWSMMQHLDELQRSQAHSVSLLEDLNQPPGTVLFRSGEFMSGGKKGGEEADVLRAGGYGSSEQELLRGSMASSDGHVVTGSPVGRSGSAPCGTIRRESSGRGTTRERDHLGSRAITARPAGRLLSTNPRAPMHLALAQTLNRAGRDLADATASFQSSQQIRTSSSFEGGADLLGRLDQHGAGPSPPFPGGGPPSPPVPRTESPKNYDMDLLNSTSSPKSSSQSLSQVGAAGGGPRRNQSPAYAGRGSTRRGFRGRRFKEPALMVRYGTQSPPSPSDQLLGGTTTSEGAGASSRGGGCCGPHPHVEQTFVPEDGGAGGPPGGRTNSAGEQQQPVEEQHAPSALQLVRQRVGMLDVDASPTTRGVPAMRGVLGPETHQGSPPRSPEQGRARPPNARPCSGEPTPPVNRTQEQEEEEEDSLDLSLLEQMTEGILRQSNLSMSPAMYNFMYTK